PIARHSTTISRTSTKSRRVVSPLLSPYATLFRSQHGVPFLQTSEFAAAMRNLGATFRHVAACAICVPTYFGGHLVLGMSSDDDAALRIGTDELESRFAAAGLATRYYSPRHHEAAFALPAYIERALEAAVAAARSAPSTA